MRTLLIGIGLTGALALVLGTGLLGCGGKVDRQFQPTERIERWSNDEWATVLRQLVTPDGYVRHDQLRSNENGVRDALFRYVGMINAAGPLNRPDLFPTDKDKLAYNINAYNAVCLFAVVKRNFPDDHSKGVIPYGIFYVDKFPIGGRSMSLNDLENKHLRPVDPRIHFAINCMSASCPPLRAEPFEADRLDEQLDEQGRIFLSDPRGAVGNGDTVVLSEIFRFFTEDFTTAAGVDKSQLLESIRKFADDDSPVHRATAYEFQKYDWSLNRPR